MRRMIVGVACSVAVAASAPAVAQHGGGGEGGGSGCGDLFGDLVHVLRNAETGQPIVEKRWVLGPQDVYLWAYCPVALTAGGEEIPFLPESCDLDPSYDAVEVDYFGRLSGGRTKERNIRMHFDEVISKIKSSQWVGRDAGGRLTTASGCTVDPDGEATLSGCTWKVIDSPQENLALYQRILKYGHLQTDPLEEDLDAHGDPALPTQYHPALSGDDWDKFLEPVTSLLPAKHTDLDACFADAPACSAPQSLTDEDFVLAAGSLGGAADKTGRITVDLVQYLNRIVKITVATDRSAAALDTLPALVRDCTSGTCSEPYAASCETVECVEGKLPAPADERFVDFRRLEYGRQQWFDTTIAAIKPQSPTTWVLDPAVPILSWLQFANAGGAEGESIAGFVRAASDSLRTVEFIHNYAVPDDLGWNFE